MWICSRCAEEVEDDFEVCWNCSTSKDGTPPETAAPAARVRDSGSSEQPILELQSVQRLFWAIIATGLALPALAGLIVRETLRAQGKPVTSLEDGFFALLIATPVFAAAFVPVAFRARSALRQTPDVETLFTTCGGYAGVSAVTAWMLLFEYWPSGDRGAILFWAPFIPFLVGYIGSWAGVFFGLVAYHIRAWFQARNKVAQ